jgi:hypothetical protein
MKSLGDDGDVVARRRPKRTFLNASGLRIPATSALQTLLIPLFIQSLPRTSVNKGKEKGRGEMPQPSRQSYTTWFSCQKFARDLDVWQYVWGELPSPERWLEAGGRANGLATGRHTYFENCPCDMVCPCTTLIVARATTPRLRTCETGQAA